MLQTIIFVLVVDVVAVDSENDSYFPPVAEKQCVKANSKGIKFTPSERVIVNYLKGNFCLSIGYIIIN